MEELLQFDKKQNTEFQNLQSKTSNNKNTYDQIGKIQGFLQSQQPQILLPKSKQHQSLKLKQIQFKIQPRFALDNFYKIPQAKPLLSKNFIDASKPKVLIKQIQIYKQPDQLTNYKIFSNSQTSFSNQPKRVSPIKQLNEQTKKQLTSTKQNNQNIQKLTLWQKYLIKSGYVCIYWKYFRGNLQDFYPKISINDLKIIKQARKKLRIEFLRMCHNNQNLFNTYFIDLEFITQAGSSLIRNLLDYNISQIYQKKQQNISEQELNQQKNVKIKFDSRFQSGNLFTVFQKIDKKTYEPIQPRTFDLILQNDINTKGYTNWFYFSIRSQDKGILKFNIVNMQKPYSLYNNGMKVFVFSYKKYKNDQIEWQRDGFNYNYYKNQIQKSTDGNLGKYNTLSFCLQQKYDDDLIYIAANIPYTYSRLINYLDGVEKVVRLNSNIYLKKQNNTVSMSSNSAPILTLTWKRDKKQKQSTQNYKKKVIGIIARQHPCETISSFVMQGLINSLVYLTHESSVQLLKKYIFKIVPMMNVDGVIYGNSRCDISGSDINRRWTKNPNKFLYPIVGGVRKLFQNIVGQNYEIDYFIDLHGHSRKLGTFIYSCKLTDEVESRCYPWLLSKICNKFVFQNCIFGLHSSKRQTARGSMQHYVTSRRSMTVQTSFLGYKKFNNIRKYQIKDLHQIGQNILKAIYLNEVRDPKVFNWTNIKNQIKTYLDSNKRIQKDQEQQQQESDSNPDQDQMTLQQKQSSFLLPTVANKIGLTEIKIVKKKKKNNQQEQRKLNLKKIEQTHKIEGFNQKQEDIRNPYTLNTYFSKNLNQVSSQNKIFKLRETRSVTKISPFKFSQRNKRSLSTNKIKLAIDIRLQQTKVQNQKTSVPTILPQIQDKQFESKNKKKDFWQNFNKQFESIIKQKKFLLDKAPRKQTFINRKLLDKKLF